MLSRRERPFPNGLSLLHRDYYQFGTCELNDGAYFCGDHSCKTYKHVGERQVQENSDLWRDGHSDQQAREWLLMPQKGGRFAPWGVGGAGGTGGRRLHGVY